MVRNTGDTSDLSVSLSPSYSGAFSGTEYNVTVEARVEAMDAPLPPGDLASTTA
jgi:hypothetical protein